MYFYEISAPGFEGEADTVEVFTVRRKALARAKALCKELKEDGDESWASVTLYRVKLVGRDVCTLSELHRRMLEGKGYAAHNELIWEATEHD